MIRITRPTRVPPPLRSRAAQAARKRATAFYSRDRRQRVQESFAPEASIFDNPEMREVLSDLFHGKCAYCEKFLGYERWGVDHFRPPAHALAADGSEAPDHYWWLAYEWTNLLPACVECMRAKGSRFPVRGQRLNATETHRNSAEKALLLDPTLDEPADHLAFRENGEVLALSDRGQVCIDVLALNRSELTELRRRTYAGLLPERAKVKQFPGLANDLGSEALEFAALRRQVVARWLAPAASKKRQTEVHRAATQTFAADAVLESVASVDATAQMATKSRWVERIRIRNVRVFRDLEVTVSSRATGQAPWTMVLGENGTGKSTLLEVVAMTVAGSERVAAMGLGGVEYLRRGSKRAVVEVAFAGYGTPLSLEMTADGIGQTAPAPTALILAYGPTRLLPVGEHLPDVARFARIRNLFDPFTPLADANTWLMGLERSEFDGVARAIRGVLALRGEAVIDRDERRHRVVVGIGKSRVPLHQLSAGYQSAVALVCDIASVVLERWPSTDVAEGLVLIDEIDAHLHPSWRMRIVSGLRIAFPRVQFVATTHDPLCLRGLEDGEAVVLRQAPDGSVYAVSDLPSVAGMRVDQLLTSEHFGLDSTIDPELDAAFSEYYLLRAKHRPTARERRRLAELEPLVQQSRILGDSQRDRLIIEAADEFLAHERIEPDGSRREALRTEAKDHIKALWQELGQS